MFLKVNEKEAVNLDHVRAITLVRRALFDPDLDEGEEFISLDEEATVFWFSMPRNKKNGDYIKVRGIPDFVKEQLR
jgi:hypothetical protein